MCQENYQQVGKSRARWGNEFCTASSQLLLICHFRVSKSRRPRHRLRQGVIKKCLFIFTMKIIRLTFSAGRIVGLGENQFAANVPVPWRRHAHGQNAAQILMARSGYYFMHLKNLAVREGHQWAAAALAQSLARKPRSVISRAGKRTAAFPPLLSPRQANHATQNE